MNITKQPYNSQQPVLLFLGLQLGMSSQESHPAVDLLLGTDKVSHRRLIEQNVERAKKKKEKTDAKR